eukprot:COSAG01_NODE_20313_length_960_cov_0.880372_1_plen_174_part_01
MRGRYTAGVLELVRAGANLSADLNGHGATALHKACEEGDLPLVRLLLRGGADVNAQALVRCAGGGAGAALDAAASRRPQGYGSAGRAAAASGGVDGAAAVTAASAAPRHRDDRGGGGGPIALAARKRGKGAHKLRRCFGAQRRLIQRRQVLAWGSTMAARLGGHSVVGQLAPDL